MYNFSSFFQDDLEKIEKIIKEGTCYESLGQQLEKMLIKSKLMGKFEKISVLLNKEKSIQNKNIAKIREEIFENILKAEIKLGIEIEEIKKIKLELDEKKKEIVLFIDTQKNHFVIDPVKAYLSEKKLIECINSVINKIVNDLTTPNRFHEVKSKIKLNRKDIADGEVNIAGNSAMVKAKEEVEELLKNNLHYVDEYDKHDLLLSELFIEKYEKYTKLELDKM